MFIVIGLRLCVMIEVYYYYYYLQLLFAIIIIIISIIIIIIIIISIIIVIIIIIIIIFVVVAVVGGGFQFSHRTSFQRNYNFPKIFKRGDRRDEEWNIRRGTRTRNGGGVVW